jgi:hypothetical protein
MYNTTHIEFKCAALVYHKNIFDIYQKKWISKCIDSVLHQSFTQFDILELNYDGTDFSVFPPDINYKKIFWNKSFNSHYQARGFLLHKAFHEMKYDIIFNVQLDKFYHLDRFKYQVEEIKRGYDIISSVNHLSKKNKKEPQNLLNIAEYLEDKFYCDQCKCSYPPVFKQIHQLSHNIENTPKGDDLFLELLRHCFVNIESLRTNFNQFNQFNKFEKMDDYRDYITNTLLKSLATKNNLDILTLKKLCHYILLFILMIENNNDITEQLNIRWFLDKNINLIENACVCLNRNVWNHMFENSSNITKDIQLWKILSKTQLKFKIINKVLFKYPEDTETENVKNIDLCHQINGIFPRQTFKKNRLQKELEREERNRKRESRKIHDIQKRVQDKEQHQKYLEQLRSKTKLDEYKTMKEKQQFILKQQNNEIQTNSTNRRMDRFYQKQMRKKQLNTQYREINLD